MAQDKILFVDDEADIREVARRFLTFAGYRVTTAASGKEALEACHTTFFALVLTDLKMPGIGGEELLGRLKELAPNTDVIIVTGYPTLDGAIRTLKAGAYDYVLKPFRLADLQKVVRRCLEQRRLRGELVVEQQLRNELQRLSTELRQVQEKERRRIARDLHDSVAQTLSSAFIHLDLLDDMLESLPQAREGVGQITSLLEHALEEVRGLAWTLRPPVLDDLGLADALRGLASNFSRRSSLHVALSIDESLESLLPFSPAQETALYHIVQESLSNIVQHAQASKVSVCLETHNGSPRLTVTDNGQGMKATAASLAVIEKACTSPFKRTVGSPRHRRGLGLWSMRDRAEEVGGTFSIHSAPGQGTTLLLTLPKQCTARQE